MKTFRKMFKTELKLSLRGMDMIIFAIVMPIAVTILIGLIFKAKPAYDGANYTFLEQSFGALASIAICASGVMGLPLVISDYRYKKILKRFKVTPVSPVSILLVQALVYFLYCIVSLVLVYAAAACFGYRMQGNFFAFLGSYLLVTLSIFSIGMMVGGLAKNPKSAGIICSLLYFPMLILSGATLPYEIMPKGLQYIANALPLTHGIKLIKAASLGLPITGVLLPLIVIISLAAICIGAAIKHFKWE